MFYSNNIDRDVDDSYYMRLAIKQAKLAAEANEVPVGAVIIKNGQLVASAGNMRERQQDATAHAELIAVRQACQELNTWRLSGCTLYVTLEPCPMCAGALVMSRLYRLVYGCADPRAGAVESIFNVANHPALNHRLKVTAGLHEEECQELLRAFFQKKRH